MSWVPKIFQFFFWFLLGPPRGGADLYYDYLVIFMMISFFLEGGLQPLPNKISRWLDPQGYCKLHNIWQCPFTIFFPTAEGGFWPKSQRMLCTSGYRCSAKSSTFRSKPSQVAKRLSNLSDTTFDPPFLWTFLYSQTVFKQACLQHIYKQAYKTRILHSEAVYHRLLLQSSQGGGMDCAYGRECTFHSNCAEKLAL